MLIECTNAQVKCHSRHKAYINDCDSAIQMMVANNGSSFGNAAWISGNCAIVVSRTYPDQTTDLFEIKSRFESMRSQCFGPDHLMRSAVFNGDPTVPKICICGRKNVGSCY
ncbi:hypothetical protein V1511DRAFT_508529 [Dipodascopsis uninucleata]